MQLPEVQNFEDPQNQQDQRIQHPFHMAVRNSAVALLGIALVGGVYWIKVHVHSNVATYWWIWGAVAGFVVVICFAHAFLAAQIGARRAGTFLKVVAGLALAGMLLGLKWYL